jgi:hypothetical protein
MKNVWAWIGSGKVKLSFLPVQMRFVFHERTLLPNSAKLLLFRHVTKGQQHRKISRGEKKSRRAFA